MRLKDFDYSSVGAYFITVCTKNMLQTLWLPYQAAAVGAAISRPPVQLSKTGLLVEAAILNISEIYPHAEVDAYCVMPNHIHLILLLWQDVGNGRLLAAPTPSVSTIIGQMKRYVSKEAGVSVWQKSFYDHIIRDKADYMRLRSYIEQNPNTFSSDKFGQYGGPKLY